MYQGVAKSRHAAAIAASSRLDAVKEAYDTNTLEGDRYSRGHTYTGYRVPETQVQ